MNKKLVAISLLVVLIVAIGGLIVFANKRQAVKVKDVTEKQNTGENFKEKSILDQNKETVGIYPIVNEVPQDIIPSEYKEEEILRQQGYNPDEVTDTNPKGYKLGYVYKDNSSTPDSKMKNIKEKIDVVRLKNENAQLKSANIVLYQDACKKIGNDASQGTQVSPKRKVWIVEMKKTSGVTLPPSPNGDGIDIIKNALITEIYDAETGNLIETNIVTAPN